MSADPPRDHAEPPTPPRGDHAELPDQSGELDAVQLALNRARAAARAKGLRPGAFSGRRGLPGTGPAGGRGRRGDASLRSGAHPDARDPQLVGASLDNLVADRGWQTPIAVGGVIGRWHAVVGEEIATHCRPETFVDGVLTVRADSTAWATQLRLLLNTVQARLDEEVGEGVVTKLVVLAPTAPSWRRGDISAPGGKGPRDTYG